MTRIFLGMTPSKRLRNNRHLRVLKVKSDFDQGFHTPRAMGLLSLGTPLPWKEAKKYAEHVHTHGITQFLHTWDRLKDREGDDLLWGDEASP